MLEDANIKMGNVLGDLFGLSGQLMIEALLKGQATVRQIAESAQEQAKKKIPQIQAALDGHRMSDSQRVLIRLSMGHLAFLEYQIAQFDEQIYSHIERWRFQHAHALLQTIPGIKKQAAAAILAGVGTDMGVDRAAVRGPAFGPETMKASANASEHRPLTPDWGAGRDRAATLDENGDFGSPPG